MGHQVCFEYLPRYSRLTFESSSRQPCYRHSGRYKAAGYGEASPQRRRNPVYSDRRRRWSPGSPRLAKELSHSCKGYAFASLFPLTHHSEQKIVDVVPYTKALTPHRLSEILLGTLHPSICTAIEQKKSTALRSCPICCSDDIPEYEFPRFSPTSRCQHEPPACRNCLPQHVEAQLFSQAIVLEINCLSYPCPEKLGYDEIKQWATPECFKRSTPFKSLGNFLSQIHFRYNSVAVCQRLSEDPNFVWCLNVKCDHGQTHPLARLFPLFNLSE